MSFGMYLRRLFLCVLMLPFRARSASKYCIQMLMLVTQWLFSSREHTNLTYHLTPLNQRYLACFLGVICDRPASVMELYIREIADDVKLREFLMNATRESKRNFLADDEPRYARRVGWYAMVRALRPSVVVETGVDKGLGSCILAAALKRNAEEGHPGRYYGTDINTKAGYLLQKPYDEYGEIVYGDSIESLKKMDFMIDVFINDSDHSVDYEMREFEIVSGKLSPKAIIVGDNSHFSDKLIEFAQSTNRQFLFFHEQPEGHWYPGSGIGVAYPTTQA
jgi:predicted O-methyltransferase YrrM